MTCQICTIIQNKLGQIYEDQFLYAYMDPTPAAEGHIVITTKEHFTIIEQVPDDVVEHLFKISNKLATIAFEILDIHGTNLIVNNGVSAGQRQSHVTVNIIPRNEDDGLNLMWVPKKLTQEELSAIELKLQEGNGNAGLQTGGSERDSIEERRDYSDDDPNKEPENYLLKQLDRVP